ncbi:hypothetical protein Taro_022807 [Colocasia esculenta]|uniref:Vacuolar sorting receptor thioredoxin-like domain-containing protein n=1 Tax=Colocasia esculenta TaxID=4460 RepID=A0A843VFH6_COLES|nr:hypothetical protein [Colocasia esculenta]
MSGETERSPPWLCGSSQLLQARLPCRPPLLFVLTAFVESLCYIAHRLASLTRQAALSLDLKKIDKCIGDPDADEENPILKAEQDAQIGKNSRGDVTILPTLVINNRQYRGKLDKAAVLKAICAGFEETTEPAVCLRSASGLGFMNG